MIFYKSIPMNIETNQINQHQTQNVLLIEILFQQLRVWLASIKTRSWPYAIHWWYINDYPTRSSKEKIAVVSQKETCSQYYIPTISPTWPSLKKKKKIAPNYNTPSVSMYQWLSYWRLRKRLDFNPMWL